MSPLTTPGLSKGAALLPILLVAQLGCVVTMTTGDYNEVITEEPAIIGQCMQMLAPSFQKIFDLEQICQELDRYLACYVVDVREASAFYTGHLPLDLFHDVHSTNAAYQGVCMELKAITPKRHCVQQKEPELRQCNDELNAVSTHLNNNYYDVDTSIQYLCRAFEKHAACEEKAFSACDTDLGHAMANFYIAALPTTCKILLGVSSKYDDIIFGPFWMGIPVECFPEDGDPIQDPKGDSMGTTFTNLCRHYEKFVPCLEEVVHKRNRTGLLYDVGSYDLFDAESQISAYQAFCPYVKDMSAELECVHEANLTVSDICSVAYSEDIYALDDESLSLQEKRHIICRATVDLLQCERQAYTSCSEEVVSAYNNYNVAILPNWCKALTGIKSRFDVTTSMATSTTRTTPARALTRPTSPKSSVTRAATDWAPKTDDTDDKTPEMYAPAYTTDSSAGALTASVLAKVIMLLVAFSIR